MFECPIYEYAVDVNIKNQLNQLERHGYPNNGYVCGNTSLHVATLFLDENVALAFVEKLIKSGADLQARNQFGCTPLHFAVLKRKNRLLEAFLNAGANPSYQDEHGNTALHYAIHSCTFSIKRTIYGCSCGYRHTNKWVVKKLLEYKVDVDILNYYNESALMWAVVEHELDVVKELLRSNASTNYHSIARGSTPLHLALTETMPDIDMVYELLQHGAELNTVDELERKPMDIALEIYNLSPYNKCIANLLLKTEILQEFDKEVASYRFQLYDSAEYTGLAEFYLNCCDEIDGMKKDRLEGNFSVHDFVKRGPHKLFYHYHERVRAYNHVFSKLKKGKYPIYCDVLLNCFEKWYFKDLFSKTYVYAKRESDQKEIVLNRDILWVISSNLSNIEMFNFIPVYSQETKSQDRFSSLLNYLGYLLNGAFSFFTHLIIKRRVL